MSIDVSIFNTVLGVFLPAIVGLVAFVYRRVEKIERRVVRLETMLESGGLGRAPSTD